MQQPHCSPHVALRNLFPSQEVWDEGEDEKREGAGGHSSFDKGGLADNACCASDVPALEEGGEYTDEPEETPVLGVVPVKDCGRA